ncbi:MAG: 16S rRNA (guanine(527)-N(7))-methyltransferase RsmG [Zoogloeaceae bacterium]|jgi:16S rRNA (guanine527-N7)-methyltransferase|nr:16S rRNA (guanine(527)-N(7))-methyltransferase RsmG [Zoogloeaceae bacterium]
MDEDMNDRQRLERGIAALGLELATDAPEKLIAYRDLLMKWNKTYNLTALKNPAEAITHHLLDALAILPALDHHINAAASPPVTERSSARCPPSSVLDVGSGGGLPGLTLAIARPELAVTLVDAVQKKTVFLRQTIIELALKNVTVYHARVETLQGRHAVITARAFAELKDFVALTRHLLAPNGHWLAMKGQNPDAELAALPTGIVVEAVQSLVVPGLNAERHLVILQQTD